MKNKLEAMREGGAKLGKITEKLFSYAEPGVTPKQIEQKAQELISQNKGKPSFATVENYKWTTCINLNSGVVHGIPESTKPLKDGDLLTVDIGFLYKGHHTDNAFTKVIGSSTPEKDKFVQAGKQATRNALQTIKPGARAGHISQAIQQTLEKAGYTPARGLTGHGVGKDLHEEPTIPCHLSQPLEETPKLKRGQTLAVEIIYLAGSPELLVDSDDWTISAKDDKLSAVFEETVEVTQDGFSILTKPALFQR